MFKCIGVLGWAFGHKYKSWDGIDQYSYCTRCGMPKGGWKA